MRRPAELRAATEDIQVRGARLTEANEVFDIGSDRETGSMMVRRIKDPTKKHAAYDRAKRNSKLGDLVGELVSRDVRFDAAQLNFKPAQGGAPGGWHRDWAVRPHPNNDLPTGADARRHQDLRRTVTGEGPRVWRRGAMRKGNRF